MLFSFWVMIIVMMRWVFLDTSSRKRLTWMRWLPMVFISRMLWLRHRFARQVELRFWRGFIRFATESLITTEWCQREPCFSPSTYKKLVTQPALLVSGIWVGTTTGHGQDLIIGWVSKGKVIIWHRGRTTHWTLTGKGSSKRDTSRLNWLIMHLIFWKQPSGGHTSRGLRYFLQTRQLMWDFRSQFALDHG